MKKITWGKSALMVGLSAGLLFACQSQEERPEIVSEEIDFVNYVDGELIPDKYIVQLNPTEINFRKTKNYASDQSAMRKVTADILSKYRISTSNLDVVYSSAVQGFSVKLSESQLAGLSRDPAIKSIEQDRIIALAPPSGKGPNKDEGGTGKSSQSIPWGITRVGGGATYQGTAKAYVIDSGIDERHPDLNVDLASGYNYYTSGKEGNLSKDLNGHGTHVAGTIAAIDNLEGVVGVAAGAKVVPVKIMDETGVGTSTSVLAGIDFVTGNANPGDVANMSLGAPGISSKFLDNAVIAMGEAGIKVAISAGNNGHHAGNNTPARAEGPNLYTVSAINSSDGLASFSNFGNPPVDFAAPGVGVLSTLPGGKYGLKSGTSMAAPHVAGLLLTGVPVAGGVALNDPDGNPDPIAVK